MRIANRIYRTRRRARTGRIRRDRTCARPVVVVLHY
jgi:hypothetical protein